MKNSNDFINTKVFKANQKYAKLQNKTEELFFQCLDEGRSLEYFYKKLDEIKEKYKDDILPLSICVIYITFAFLKNIFDVEFT